MIPALDISQWQGGWQDRGDPIVMIKMSGGDNGLYMDTDAATNYSGAVADGRAVGGYHMAGGQSASSEASFFYRAMSPVAENDVFSVDIEKNDSWDPNAAGIDPVAWTLEFINYLGTRGITGGLVYMNLSTLLAHDWTPVFAKWGLWLADWAVSPEANIPTSYTYVMQQYSDGPVYDHDEWFGTVEEFKAYGYHAPQPTPVDSVPAAPAPVQTPPVESTLAPAPTTPVVTPTAGTVVTPTKQPEEPKEPVKASPSIPEAHWYDSLVQLWHELTKKGK